MEARVLPGQLRLCPQRGLDGRRAQLERVEASQFLHELRVFGPVTGAGENLELEERRLVELAGLEGGDPFLANRRVVGP